MKLTKNQLKNLVEEVIAEQEGTLINEDQILEESFADLIQKMKVSARSGLRSFGRIAKNSKASREFERVLDATENATPEEKNDATWKAIEIIKPTFKQMIDVFSEYEMRVSQAAEKMNSKLKQSAIDPSLLQKLGDLLSKEDIAAPEDMPVMSTGEEGPGGLGTGTNDPRQDFGTVRTGPPKGMEDEEGNRVSEAEASVYSHAPSGVSAGASKAAYDAAIELTNWVVSHESYLNTLTDIAGKSGQGGAFKELLNAVSGQEPEMDKGVAMSVSDDPEQPVGLQKDRKPRGGVEKARATRAPGTGIGKMTPGAIGTRTGGRLEETINLSEKKLKKLIKNEYKNNK
jgi:hypothetical protein